MALFDTKQTKAYLALADGTIFEGLGFGALADIQNPCIGEVVFNTSLYGYQEITTDPSYAGQIMCFTYPQIGNVGCNQQDWESNKVYTEGVIIRNETLISSNFRAEQDFDSYLKNANKMGLSGIDTRALVQHLRDHGSQMGAMACCSASQTGELVSVARSKGSMLGKDYVTQVSCKSPYEWSESTWSIKSNSYQKISDAELTKRPLVVAIDCGIKRNILRQLIASGFRVKVVPAHYHADKIAELNPQGLFLSNGPGDPAVHTTIVSTIQQFLGKIPIFGICLGHQLLGLAFGAKTYKLKYGHRGGNHPVKDLTTGIIEITVQNHGFAVDRDSLPKSIQLTHVNLNDQTVEGLEAPDMKAFSVQYHPEASPGPHDSSYLFSKFYKLVTEDLDFLNGSK